MVRAAERAGGRPARASVWLEDRARRGGTARGGQPSGLDRDRIIAAAVRLLDAEGLAKFSMRRLATELNVTAMSVYWYVDTKDDLLELALDLVFGDVRLPPEDSDEDWRDQLRALAKEYREVLVRHPWVSPLAGTFLNIGPHSLDFSMAVQRVVRRTGLPALGQTGAIAAVFQFVYGFGTIEGHFVERCAAAGMSQDEYFRDAMSAVTAAPELSELVQQSADLMEARGGDTVEEMRERDFTFALDTLIAGIETMVDRFG
ncbi:TetR/AcrR family transcriptional regulator [Streptomyces phyllanthi]|uniref:TetR/AcrR family transcriptional regulator n=1 Tax=Streptomyces phyllanthi TaxID=1803180 RepID=A0A5N8WBT0_9ACTN|nr:TetR/AcrR family transcriptional regulator [Streptomyces phyllanthi]MPY44940.1 TetR/AcrR family transcriptional regulator [Streptomyces phyllanthi]